MGNIGSQTGQITQRPVQEEQWAHSFPRTQPRLHQHKVLPDRDARQKLRTTNNGEVIKSGGTLSGRTPQNRSSIEREEDVSAREYEIEESRGPPGRTYFSNQRDPLHKSGSRYSQANSHHRQYQNGFVPNCFQEQMKRFGSEPDLRFSSVPVPVEQEMKEKLKAKKKYKAPPPPNNPQKQTNTLDWDHVNNENISQVRKNRLFKTRAETKKNNYSSPVNNHNSLDYNNENNFEKPINNKHNDLAIENSNLQRRESEANLGLRSNRFSLPDMTLVPTFQEELKEKTMQLRNISNIERDEKEKLKTLDHHINRSDKIRKKIKDIMVEQENKPTFENLRGEGSGKSSTSGHSPHLNRIEKKEQPKIFYFGMDDQMKNENYHNDIIDHFTSNLHPLTHIPKIEMGSSDSEISSEMEMDETTQVSKSGIDLQLRPILPKKQLEIPRFSPAAAWRLLSVDSADPGGSTIASDDAPVFIEDRIEKYSRPPPPTMQVGPRSSNDKSGDSGISGDAGPAGYDDSPENIMNSRSNLQLESHFRPEQGMSWTPQQDLGDDSSLEEGIHTESPGYKSRKPPMYSNKPHVLSLSLPRENHLTTYMGEKYIQPQHSSLQKLKRSVSGVLSNLPNKKDVTQPNLVQEQNDNWFLSKSAPNSLNNGFNSLEIRNSQKSDEIDHPLVPAPKNNPLRVIYLPEYENNQDHRQTRSRSKDETRERSKSADRTRSNFQLSLYSKSCENISAEVKHCSEPEDLQDPPKLDKSRSSSKPKKFTFQSTVRQIERKRIAERLSREAEKKEKQRLRELEAMQKVEEEFQKKRAREKASIRQQLRLFSMDDVAWSSLPPNLELKDDIPAPIRPEPDGAVSSSTTSSPPPVVQKAAPPTKKVYQKNKKLSSHLHKSRASSDSSDENKIKAPATQILSEYRQPQRDYKEYRGSARYMGDINENHTKHTTVHPKVTCNMPKAKGQNANSNARNGTNYRKDFAHGGIKSNRSVGSSYSEESQSQNNSPRMYHNKHAPITRF